DNSEKGVNVVTCEKGKVLSDIQRPLKVDNLNIFIRNYESINILDKITYEKAEISTIASPRKPYGFGGNFIISKNFKITTYGMKNPVKIYGKKKIGYVENELIKNHREWIGGYKVFTARSNNIGTELNDDNLNTIIGKPNEIVTETYLVIGHDLNLTLNSATNLS